MLSCGIDWDVSCVCFSDVSTAGKMLTPAASAQKSVRCWSSHPELLSPPSVPTTSRSQEREVHAGLQQPGCIWGASCQQKSACCIFGLKKKFNPLGIFTVQNKSSRGSHTAGLHWEPVITTGSTIHDGWCKNANELVRSSSVSHESRAAAMHYFSNPVFHWLFCRLIE